jgi:hypothetical protein
MHRPLMSFQPCGDVLDLHSARTVDGFDPSSKQAIAGFHYGGVTAKTYITAESFVGSKQIISNISQLVVVWSYRRFAYNGS